MISTRPRPSDFFSTTNPFDQVRIDTTAKAAASGTTSQSCTFSGRVTLRKNPPVLAAYPINDINIYSTTKGLCLEFHSSERFTRTSSGQEVTPGVLISPNAPPSLIAIFNANPSRYWGHSNEMRILEKASGLGCAPDLLFTSSDRCYSRWGDYGTWGFAVEKRIINVFTIFSASAQLARSLAKLHNEGIVHNNIHGETIVLSSEGGIQAFFSGYQFSSDPDTPPGQNTVTGLSHSFSPEKKRLWKALHSVQNAFDDRRCDQETFENLYAAQCTRFSDSFSDRNRIAFLTEHERTIESWIEQQQTAVHDTLETWKKSFRSNQSLRPSDVYSLGLTIISGMQGISGVNWKEKTCSKCEQYACTKPSQCETFIDIENKQAMLEEQLRRRIKNFSETYEELKLLKDQESMKTLCRVKTELAFLKIAIEMVRRDPKKRLSADAAALLFEKHEPAIKRWSREAASYREPSPTSKREYIFPIGHEISW